MKPTDEKRPRVKGAAKPVCACCGKPYGRRHTHSETVRWDTPVKVRNEIKGPRGEQGNVYILDALDFARSAHKVGYRIKGGTQ